MAVKKKADSMTVNSKTANDIKKGRKYLARVAKHTTNAMLAVLTACVFTGCIRNRLLQVERTMESDIETADSLIYSINEPTGKRNRALYALLKTQIDYKRFRVAISDSTIRIATDHYGRKYKGYHSAMAWYSLGCISAELGNDSTAADAYLTAIRLFPDTLVRYYALAEQNLSYIFLDHRMDAEAIPLIKSCRANAVRLKDSAAIAFCDYNIAKSLLYNNDYEASRKMFLELKDSKWLSPNTINNPLIHLAKIDFVNNNYTGAISYADSFLINNQCTASNSTAYSIKADALYQLNFVDSAYHYYKLSLIDASEPYTICDSYRRLSEINSLKGNTDSASFFAKQASAWMDTITSSIGSDNILRALLSHSNSIPKPINRYTLLLIIISSILLIAIIVFSLRSKPNHTEPLNKLQMNEVQQANPPVVNSLQAETIADFKRDLISFKQSDLYNEMIIDINERKELEYKQKNDVTTKFQTSSELKRIRAFIYASSTKLNGTELDFCIFTMIGFEQKDFHKLFNLSQSGSRNLKIRIKDKMPESIYNCIFVDRNDIKQQKS